MIVVITVCHNNSTNTSPHSGVRCMTFTLSARVGGDIISYEFIFVLTVCLNLSLSYLPPLPKCDLLTATLQTCAWCFEEWRYLTPEGGQEVIVERDEFKHIAVCAHRGVKVALSNHTAPSDEINFRGRDRVCKCVVQLGVCRSVSSAVRWNWDYKVQIVLRVKYFSTFYIFFYFYFF